MLKSDGELFEVLKESLFTAVVGDILDSLGFHQQFLPPAIRPLDPKMVVAGRAMPLLVADLPAGAQAGIDQNRPFGLMLDALDGLQPGEVYMCTGASPTYALWGEIMSTRAQKLGAAGAVLNGYSRDTRGILSLNFPTFSFGSYAQDQRSRGTVVDFRIPIQIGRTRIEPGDLIFGDLEGILIVPRAVEHDALSLALEKVRKEQLVKTNIAENGMSSAQAFKTFGVL